MTIGTLLGYWIGKREAILQIAAARHAWGLGLLFVLSAGFAREYDGADLRAEPWHLLLPLAASFGACTLLFLLLYPFVCGKGERPWPMAKAFRSFLTLFWMTAPFAWLYAIPVEQTLTPPNATLANIYLLGIVSVWRVALMVRVIVVLAGVPVSSAIGIVLWFGSTAVLVALFVMVNRTVVVMGGVRATESEAVATEVAVTVGFLCLIVWPICLIILFATAGIKGCPWRIAELPPPRKVTASLWTLGLLSNVVWFAILPMTQPMQQRRHHAETLMYSQRENEAVRFLSQFSSDDFPPGWMPIPMTNRLQHAESLPILEAIVELNPPAWVRERLVPRSLVYASRDVQGKDRDVQERFVVVLEKLPEAQKYVASHPWDLQTNEFPEDLQQRIKRLEPATENSE